MLKFTVEAEGWDVRAVFSKPDGTRPSEIIRAGEKKTFQVHNCGVILDAIQPDTRIGVPSRVEVTDG